MRLLSPSMAVMLSGSILLLASCGQTQGHEQAKTSEAQQVAAGRGRALPVDTAASKLLWKGSKLIGDDHSGFAPVADGQVSVSGGQVTGGKIVIDLKDLQPTDQDSVSNGKLKGHLSSADFFDVALYPTASFEITRVEKGAVASGSTPDSGKDARAAGIQSNALVTGNMTIKGIAKSITFPAEIHADSSAVDLRQHLQSTGPPGVLTTEQKTPLKIRSLAKILIFR